MFLDISVGIILSIFANWYFGIDLTWGLVLIIILFAISPDADFLWNYFRQRVTDQSHRDTLHYPLVFIPLGALTLLLFNKVLVVLFVLAVFWHFLNDTMFSGLSVRWFWPISNKHFNLFGILGYQTPGKPKLPFKFLYIWTPEQIRKIEEKYGDPNWIKNVYLKPNLMAMIEYLVFISTLFFLIFYVR